MAIVGITKTALNKDAHGAETSTPRCVPISPFATRHRKSVIV